MFSLRGEMLKMLILSLGGRDVAEGLEVPLVSPQLF